MPDVEISIEVRATTRWPNGSRKSILAFDGKTEEWIPWSQVNDHCEEKDGTITSIFISEWLAEKKGFI